MKLTTTIKLGQLHLPLLDTSVAGTIARSRPAEIADLFIRDTPAALADDLTQILLLPDHDDADLTPFTDLLDVNAAASSRLIRFASIGGPASFRGWVGNNLEGVIHMVGVRRVKEILAATLLGKLFNQNCSLGAYSGAEVWRHSVGVAVTARRLYNLVYQDPAGAFDAFLAGLLHDLGIMAAHAVLFEDGFAEAVGLQQQRHSALVDEEQALLGTDHQAIGAAVLRAWHLPEPFVWIAGQHHREATPPDQVIARLLHTIRLADWVCSEAHIGYADLGQREHALHYDSYTWLRVTEAEYQEAATGSLAEVEQLARAGWFNTLRLQQSVFARSA